MSVKEPLEHPAPGKSDAGPPPPHAILMQMVMGMWVAQIAGAAARFGVADQIAAGVTDSDELARAVGADTGALYRLLRACATVGLVSETATHQFVLTPVGECLRSDAPRSMKDFVIAETAPGHWLPWGRLYDAIKDGREMATATLGMPPWEYYAANPEEGIGFARAMGNLSAIVAETIAPAYDPSPFHRIVDIGGSQGVLLRSLLRRAPQAEGVLFDLPEIIESARPGIEASEFAGRIRLAGGDFFSDVPADGDLYVLKHILHDWDDERAATILSNVHRASSRGKVLIVDGVLPDQPQPSPVSLMDLNMLVMLGGRERTASQFAALLGKTGFRIDRLIPLPGMVSLIEASRV